MSLGDDFVVTNPFNKFVRKRDVLDMVKSHKLAFSSYDRQVEYVRVYRDNTMAVVAGSETVVWSGKMPTAGQASRLMNTVSRYSRCLGYEDEDNPRMQWGRSLVGGVPRSE